MSARSAARWPTLRRAGRADAPAIALLLERCLPAPWSAEVVAAVLLARGGFGLVAEAAEAPADLPGVILCQAIADQVEVLQVAVAPEERRRGLGRFLLEAGLADAAGRGAREAWLEVRVGNTAARTLYEQAGFEERGVRRRYYHDGEDAVVMRRAVGPLAIG